MNTELKERILAYNRARRAREEIVTRVRALGGIEIAEGLARWKSEALEKIETLPAVTRTIVKKLLGIA